MALSFEETVYRTLATAGVGVLSDPKRFLSYVMDLCDESSVELSVLIRNCDEEVLGPYLKAADESSGESLEMASTRALYVLVDKRSIDRGRASLLCAGMRSALERCLGEREQIIGQQVKEPIAPEASVQPETMASTEAMARPETTALPATVTRPVVSTLPTQRDSEDITQPVAVTLEAPRARDTQPVAATLKAPRAHDTQPSEQQGPAVQAPAPTTEAEPSPRANPSQPPNPASPTKTLPKPQPSQRREHEETPEVPAPPASKKRPLWPALALALVATLAIAAFVVYANLGVITFDGNGAKSGSMDSVWHWGKGPVTLPEPSYARDGYDFKGWSTSPDGAELTGQPNQEASLPGKQTLYAVWARSEVTFTFTCGYNRTDAPVPVDRTYELGSQVELPECMFSLQYRIYDFSHWEDVDTGDTYEPGDTLTATEPHTFEAQWKETRFVVDLSDYWSSKAGIENIIADLGETVTLPEMTLEREWYRFVGWYDLETEEVHQPGESIDHTMYLLSDWELDIDQCLKITEISQGDSKPYFVSEFVENVSDMVIDVVLTVDFYDENGELIRSEEQSCLGMAPGQRHYFGASFVGKGGSVEVLPESCEVRHTLEESDLEPLWPSVEVKEWSVDGNVLTITCENVSDHRVTVTGSTIYAHLNGNGSIRTNAYAGGEGTYEPGESFTITDKLPNDEKVDDVEVFFSGEGK